LRINPPKVGGGLKFETDAGIGQKGAFCKGLYSGAMAPGAPRSSKPLAPSEKRGGGSIPLAPSGTEISVGKQPCVIIYCRFFIKPKLSDCRGLPASGCVAADTEN